MIQENSEFNTVSRIKLPSIQFSIGVLIALTSSVLISIYFLFPKKQEDIKFTGTVTAVACAIYSAFYAGRGLKYNADSKKIDRAIECALRWHDLNAIDSLRLTLKQVADISDSNKRLEKIEELIKEDKQIEYRLIEVLNFFEQLGVFVEEKVLDEELLKKFFFTIVVRYFEIFNPWIFKRRNAKPGFARLYVSLEFLYDRWKKQDKNNFKS